MSKEVIEALDRVIGYLEDEQEHYELSDPAGRQKHIWTAVQALIRHRDDLALDDD